MFTIRRFLVIVSIVFLCPIVVLQLLIGQPATAAAQTSDSPAEPWVLLPQSWNGPSSISQSEIDATIPPFALAEHQGEFTLTRIDDDDSPYIRVRRAPEEQASGQPGQLRFAWTITGEELAELADQVLTVTFAARGYAPPAGARVFIEEENGTATSSTSLRVNNVQWEDFVLNRAIAPDATAIRIGLDWDQAQDTGWLELSELHVQRSAAAEYTGVLAPTDAPTAPPAPTPTPTFLVVTSTPTAVNLFAAATLAAQATADARTTGTATPTPASMMTATFTPTPTATPTPIVVTNTPTPSNMETATIMALEADARAFTTGTPTPYPAEISVLVATPTSTVAPKGQPTPLFVLLEDIPPTRASTATPAFPGELVDKIIFKANLFGTNRRPDYMIMNPDGTDVGRLTGAYHYNRAAERDHYSGDRSFYASVSKEQDGFHRIQIFYDFIKYGTQRQLTFFGAGTAWDPAWSPVDERVVMVSNESKNDEIWIVERGDWPAIQLTDNDWEWDNHPSFSPDGSQIVFMSNRNSGRRQLWIMDTDGGRQRQLTNFPFEAWDPVWVKFAD